MKIELLYFDGCPNVTATLERLKGILAEIGLNAPIILTKVADREMAQLAGFLGSPTIRINGVDIEPSARSSKDYGLMCRMYEVNGGAPSDAMIRLAVVEANGRA